MTKLLLITHKCIHSVPDGIPEFFSPHLNRLYNEHCDISFSAPIVISEQFTAKLEIIMCHSATNKVEYYQFQKKDKIMSKIIPQNIIPILLKTNENVHLAGCL